MNVTNSLGLVFAFSDRGTLRSIEAAPIRISLRPPSLLPPSGANLYLRKRSSPVAYAPLLGAEIASFRASEHGFEGRGSWAGLDFALSLRLAPGQLAWQWRLEVTNRLAHPVELDVVYVQDVGLTAAGEGLVNEAYVSQYLERRIFAHRRFGSVVCCRQNMRQPTGHPWLMLACAGRAAAASTDGLQLYGASYRSTGEPEGLRADRLGGELSGESSIVALQAEPFVVNPDASHATAFVATYLPHHPQASSELDLLPLAKLAESFADLPPWPADQPFSAPARSRFDGVQLLAAEDLREDQLGVHFGETRRNPEAADGALLSFFADGPRHVVLREKEVRVTRPHGHIMQAKLGLIPDERIMSTTAFACGVFNAHLTQGNTNFNTLLSVCTQPVLPSLASGQRIVVGLEDGEWLLGVPSAFEMGLNHCRWIYQRGSTTLEVCTWTAPGEPRVNLAVEVVRGSPVRLSLVHHFDDLSGWTIEPGDPHEFVARPRAESAIARHHPDARFRLLVNSQEVGYVADSLRLGAESEGACFVLEVEPTAGFCVSFVGEVVEPCEVGRILDPGAQRRADCAAAAQAFRELSRGLSLGDQPEIAAIGEALPWYGANALIHFLTPYGLEQFSGAAWGTRDVCQGPLDLLLGQERFDEARQVLRIVFSHQSEDGGWPQWWMFDRYRSVRADSAHGDVIYWCILALCSYVRTSGDLAFLEERLPWFGDPGGSGAELATVAEHVDRIVSRVVDSFVPGTALVQFGGGDWNDSLQPVSQELARRLVSSWTVQMCYQALREYRELCEHAGRKEQAAELGALAERVLADFHRWLMKDGVVAGYGLVGDDGKVEVLLHPTDARTGVRYSLLPMDRGILSGAFSREQAEQHLTLIERHLKGPDGARLMDRPLPYRGGLQTIFQRAESSTYFGREIGLMYVHEHLRYAEAQARMGRADALLRALRQAIPVGYREVVPAGTLRQANCYYSSSDVLFASRYEADARYDEVLAGRLPLEGGWRVYSSGPGIYVGLVITRLLGLRVEFGQVVLDPVLPRSLDGLAATLRFRGASVTFTYRVEGPGFGPRALSVNGVSVPFEREESRYREGGAVLPLERFLALLDADHNRVDIQL